MPLNSGSSISPVLKMILQRVRGTSLDKHIYTAPVTWDRQVCKTVLTLAHSSEPEHLCAKYFQAL